jgi:hypothetical protein
MRRINCVSPDGRENSEAIHAAFTMRVSVKNRNTMLSQIDSLLVFIIAAYTKRQMKARAKR